MSSASILETGLKDKRKPPFESVYDRYYFDIFRYLSSRMNQRQDVEDLTSEVFLYCYAHYEDYDPDKSSLSTWLYLVTNSRLKNYYRDRRESVDMEDVEPFLAAEGEELEQAVYLEQLRAELAKALEDLPERQKRAVVLRYFKEWDYSKIALDLDTTEGNIRVIISRALDRMEKQCPRLKEFLISEGVN